MRRFSIAVIQMASGQDPEENLQALSAFVREAARRGASAAALPESVSYRGVEMERYAEEVPGGPTFQRLSALARETGMWLHGGSIYEKNPQGGRPYNCTMVIRPDGTLAAKYRKLHPFDVTVPGGSQMRESSQICPGDAIVTVDAGELGTWGLSVCYDLRFGELYRIMALEGAQVLFGKRLLCGGPGAVRPRAGVPRLRPLHGGGPLGQRGGPGPRPPRRHPGGHRPGLCGGDPPEGGDPVQPPRRPVPPGAGVRALTRRSASGPAPAPPPGRSRPSGRCRGRRRPSPPDKSAPPSRPKRYR